MLSGLLSLAIFVAFCDAQCTFIGLEIASRGSVQGCKDVDGTMREFGSQWLNKCDLCTCDEIYGIQCCSMLMRPVDYDKRNCKEIVNQLTCMITVVRKDNSSVVCKVRWYIG
ncbi:beta-microseminoprotein E1-like [Phascolarctos cinereus]